VCSYRDLSVTERAVDDSKEARESPHKHARFPRSGSASAAAACGPA